MQSKKIIILLVSLFVITSAYLFFVDSRDNSLDFQKNWWIVYFNDPKGNALDFVIENHSDRNSFRWKILDGKNVLSEDDASIDKGSQKSIAVPTENFSDKKITIQVSDGIEKKEIYKFTGLGR